MSLQCAISKNWRLMGVQLTLLHFGDQFLVKQASSLVVQWAVDGDYIALSQHLLQVVYTSASNLFLKLRFKRLVIKVKQFLAVEWLESSQHALAYTPNGDCTHNLVLEIVFILSNSSDIPVSTGDLLMSWDEIANKGEDSHDNMLCHRHDVGASHFSNGDAPVSLVCSVEVDVIRPNTGSDCELELLSFGESFGGQVTWMEADSVESLARSS